MAYADAAAAAAVHRPDTAAALTCPHCARPMLRRRVERAQVDLDDCPEHGTWFDRGELQTVARTVAAMRAYGPRIPGGAALAGAAAVGLTAGAAGAALATAPAAQQIRRGAHSSAVEVAGDIALEAAEFVDPVNVAEGVGVMARVAGHVASAGVEATAGMTSAVAEVATSGGVEVAAEAAGAIAEGAGTLLSGAFEILGSIFEAFV